jgi:hypothetical protein
MDIRNTPPEYFIESYLLQSKKKQHIYQKSICGGNLKDYEEYRHYCGKLKGLIEADEIAKDVYRSIYEVAERDIKERELYGKE